MEGTGTEVSVTSCRGKSGTVEKTMTKGSPSRSRREGESEYFTRRVGFWPSREIRRQALNAWVSTSPQQSSTYPGRNRLQAA